MIVINDSNVENQQLLSHQAINNETTEIFDIFAELTNASIIIEPNYNNNVHNYGDIDAELNIYKSLHQIEVKTKNGTYNNQLTWWKLQSPSLPLLSGVAKRTLSVPSTSASSERTFSIAGNIVYEKRSSIRPDLFSASVIPKSNWDKNGGILPK